MMTDLEKKAYLEAAPAQLEVVRVNLGAVLALLRSLYLSYQTSHWTSSGIAGYGDHLLFQRLYESTQAEIDALAEKMIGYLGEESVSLNGQLRLMASFAARWAEVKSPHRRGLLAESDLQTVVKSAYERIKASGAMTLGLDDWLMATASAHETNTYLLQQVLSVPPSRVAKVLREIDVEEGVNRFFPDPRRSEVNEFARSNAVTNVKSIAQEAKEDLADVGEVSETPPTPTEIKEKPGGASVSTLNRLVVLSEDPVADKAVPMNERRMKEWLKEVEERST